MSRDSKGCRLLHKRKRKTSKKDIPFKEIKKLVFDRDGWRCRLCGSEDDLTTHHIKEGDDVDSFITVCKMHHKILHKKWKNIQYMTT